MPMGQLEEPTPPPPVGGVGVGLGTVVGGVDDDGELPPPQESAKNEYKPRKTTATGVRLPTSIGTNPSLNTPALNTPVLVTRGRTVPPALGARQALFAE
jgi:hypothetical protein